MRAGRERPVKKLLLIGVVGLLLAGAGGGGAWWWMHRAQAASPSGSGEKVAHEEPADPSDTGVLAMEPFLVNLADSDSPRFLRATLQLVIADKERAEHLTEDAVAKARIRSAVLELLTTQKSGDLVTPEGKASLKKHIVEQSSKILTEAHVVDVLFSEFVVQF